MPRSLVLPFSPITFRVRISDWQDYFPSEYMLAEYFGMSTPACTFRPEWETIKDQEVAIQYYQWGNDSVSLGSIKLTTKDGQVIYDKNQVASVYSGLHPFLKVLSERPPPSERPPSSERPPPKGEKGEKGEKQN